MKNVKIPVEELTSEISSKWSNEDWLKWYDSNRDRDEYSELIVRDAKKPDVPAIRKLVASTRFECDPKTATSRLVAVTDKKVVGYQEIEKFSLQNASFIRLVVVHPDYRRKGVGESMVGYLIGDGGRYQCKIHYDNEASLKLFEKLGFVLGDCENGLVSAFYGFNEY